MVPPPPPPPPYMGGAKTHPRGYRRKSGKGGGLRSSCVDKRFSVSGRLFWAATTAIFVEQLRGPHHALRRSRGALDRGPCLAAVAGGCGNADDFVTRYRTQLEDYVAKLSCAACCCRCDSLPSNTRLYKSIAAEWAADRLWIARPGETGCGWPEWAKQHHNVQLAGRVETLVGIDRAGVGVARSGIAGFDGRATTKRFLRLS